MSHVNRYNFLRWDDGNAPVSVEDDLPNGYLFDRTRCDYKPILIASEAMRFYINAEDGLSFIDDPNTHKLALVNEFGTVINADIAPLQVHSFDIISGTVKTFYAEVIVDGTVTPGSYLLQIKTSLGVVKLTSNYFTVLASSSTYKNYSTLCKFRHDRYFYGISYQTLDTFYQQFRLHINRIDDQFEDDKEVYNEVTTGKQRTYNNFMKKLDKAETYYFDRYAHEAAAVMFDHDEIYLNLKRYTPKAVYKVNFDQRSKVFKGEIDLYKEEFASANRCTS